MVQRKKKWISKTRAEKSIRQKNGLSEKEKFNKGLLETSLPVKVFSEIKVMSKNKNRLKNKIRDYVKNETVNKKKIVHMGKNFIHMEYHI